MYYFFEVKLSNMYNLKQHLASWKWKLNTAIDEKQISKTYFSGRSSRYSLSIDIAHAACTSVNTISTLPAVGNGGISLGGTVGGSSSFLIGNTKISTTMRMIKRTNTTAAAVTILHFLELQQNEKKIQLIHSKGSEHSMQSTLL